MKFSIPLSIHHKNDQIWSNPSSRNAMKISIPWGEVSVSVLIKDDPIQSNDGTVHFLLWWPPLWQGESLQVVDIRRDVQCGHGAGSAGQLSLPPHPLIQVTSGTLKEKKKKNCLRFSFLFFKLILVWKETLKSQKKNKKPTYFLEN